MRMTIKQAQEEFAKEIRENQGSDAAYQFERYERGDMSAEEAIVYTIKSAYTQYGEMLVSTDDDGEIDVITLKELEKQIRDAINLLRLKETGSKTLEVSTDMVIALVPVLGPCYGYIKEIIKIWNRKRPK